MTYVRDNGPVSFSPFPFRRPRTTRIRWRGSQPESLEYGYELISSPATDGAYSWLDIEGAPLSDVSGGVPIRITRAVFTLTTSTGMTATVEVYIDGVLASFNTGVTSLAVGSNTLIEYTADPGQSASTDIEFDVVMSTPNDFDSELDMVLYALFP